MSKCLHGEAAIGKQGAKGREKCRLVNIPSSFCSLDVSLRRKILGNSLHHFHFWKTVGFFCASLSLRYSVEPKSIFLACFGLFVYFDILFCPPASGSSLQTQNELCASAFEHLETSDSFENRLSHI